MTQEQRLLNLLIHKEVVALPTIMELRIASHTKVISNLRRKGHIIQNLIDYIKGVKCSYYVYKGKV